MASPCSAVFCASQRSRRSSIQRFRRFHSHTPSYTAPRSTHRVPLLRRAVPRPLVGAERRDERVGQGSCEPASQKKRYNPTGTERRPCSGGRHKEGGTKKRPRDSLRLGKQERARFMSSASEPYDVKFANRGGKGPVRGIKTTRLPYGEPGRSFKRMPACDKVQVHSTRVRNTRART